jgi:hypothetical protein
MAIPVLADLIVVGRARSSYRRKPVSSEKPNKPSAEGESAILVLDSGLPAFAEAKPCLAGALV